MIADIVLKCGQYIQVESFPLSITMREVGCCERILYVDNYGTSLKKKDVNCILFSAVSSCGGLKENNQLFMNRYPARKLRRRVTVRTKATRNHEWVLKNTFGTHYFSENIYTERL